MFGLDLRSLALLRVALAVLILWDLGIASTHLRALFTDEGVLPRSYVIGNESPFPSLHLASGAGWYEVLLFAVEAACALLLLVGWRTRTATVACWVLLLSRQTRNPLILFGPDTMLRASLFWAMFLPLGARGSLDAALGRTRPAEPEPPGPWLGVAGVAYIVQFMLIYIFNGLMKTGPTWHVTHTAVTQALSLDIYSRPLGRWLNQFDGLTAALTIGTLWLEIWGPALLVLPVGNRWGRLAACALFGALQIGFNVTLQLGLFGPVMIGIMLALLPAEFWTWFAEPLGRRLTARFKFIADGVAGFRRWCQRRRTPAAPPKVKPTPAPARRQQIWLRRLPRLLRDAGLLALLGYVVAWNHDNLPGHAPLVATRWRWVAEATGMDQLFNMFAPDPQSQDGWYVMRGTLVNGETVDVSTGASPATFDEPPVVADTYFDQRWGALLITIGFQEYESYRQPFARYLGNEWNRTHRGGQRLRTLEIIFMYEEVGPNHTKSPPEQTLLWTENF